MKVNGIEIDAFNPYATYKKDYLEFNGNLEEFLNLPKISYDHKIDVACRFLSDHSMFKWAVLCVESFVKSNPNDSELSQLILNISSLLKEYSKNKHDELNDYFEKRRHLLEVGTSYSPLVAYIFLHCCESLLFEQERAPFYKYTDSRAYHTLLNSYAVGTARACVEHYSTEEEKITQQNTNIELFKTIYLNK